MDSDPTSGTGLETRHVLIVWGGEHGGTEGIARMLGDALLGQGVDVTLLPAAEAGSLSSFSAVIVGGALYTNRWHAAARRFVLRHVSELRRVPVWFFSSGPLDASADDGHISPNRQVSTLMERVGALGHVTFGGRLAPDVRGFPAAAMAKTHSGDFRNPEQIRSWAAELARMLPTASPNPAIDPPGGSPRRLVAYGLLGWLLSAALWFGLSQLTSANMAYALRAAAAPILFAVLAYRYFLPRGAREPWPSACVFTLCVGMGDALLCALTRDFALFRSFVGVWLPLCTILLTTWFTGFLFSTLPWPTKSERSEPGHASA